MGLLLTIFFSVNNSSIAVVVLQFCRLSFLLYAIMRESIWQISILFVWSKILWNEYKQYKYIPAAISQYQQIDRIYVYDQSSL